MAQEPLQSIGSNKFKLAVFKDINNYIISFIPQSPSMNDLIKKKGSDLCEIALSMSDGEVKRLVDFPRGAYLEMERIERFIDEIGHDVIRLRVGMYYTSNGRSIARPFEGLHYIGATYDGVLRQNPLYLFASIDTSRGEAMLRAISYASNNEMTALGNYMIDQGQSALYTYLTSAPYEFYDPDAYGDLGYSDIGGGGGTFDFTGDEVMPDDVPTFDVIDSGFIQMYKAEIPQIRQLASYLWTTDFFTNIVKITQDPIDIIMGLNVFPFEISGNGARRVQAGNVTTPVVMSIPEKQFIDIDCGTVEIKNFYGSYLDFSPYTKCELFLPYSGTHGISLDDIMGKAVNIRYRVDLLSGCCNIFVIVNNNVLYSFSGACSVSVPITSRSFTEMYGNIFNSALSGAQALSTGNIANFGSAVAGGVMQCKPSFARSGNCGGNIGFGGVQKPYFIFTVPRSAIPKNQNTFIGYPIFATYNLNALKGFTVIEEIHFKASDGMTVEEVDETVKLLKGGVIL